MSRIRGPLSFLILLSLVSSSSRDQFFLFSPQSWCLPFHNWIFIFNCTGDIPTARSGHAVTSYGKYMLLYGGINFQEEVAYNDLYILDTGKRRDSKKLSKVLSFCNEHQRWFHSLFYFVLLHRSLIPLSLLLSLISNNLIVHFNHREPPSNIVEEESFDIHFR